MDIGMHRLKVLLSYDGTNLIGFQKNKDGDSVQSLVEDAIFGFAQVRHEVVGCGRTDAGVHALAMPAHFDLEESKDPDTVKRALNFYLNDKPVSIVSCEIVPNDFHARFSCKKRYYKYQILNQDFPPVFDKNFVWHIPQKLDIDAMRRAAEKFLGRHDWTSFCATESIEENMEKTLDEILITDNGERVTIEVAARSFFHHQVRNIVGTLVEIGKGKDMEIDQIFKSKDRKAAGPTAPASGLFFVKAEY